MTEQPKDNLIHIFLWSWRAIWNPETALTNTPPEAANTAATRLFIRLTAAWFLLWNSVLPGIAAANWLSTKTETLGMILWWLPVAAFVFVVLGIIGTVVQQALNPVVLRCFHRIAYGQWPGAGFIRSSESGTHEARDLRVFALWVALLGVLLVAWMIAGVLWPQVRTGKP